MLKCCKFRRGQRAEVLKWRERSFVTALSSSRAASLEPIRLEFGPLLYTGSVHGQEEDSKNISKRDHSGQYQHYARSNRAREKHDGGSKSS